MNQKGQGALEYLLLIGGAILIAAVVLAVVSNLTGSGSGAARDRTGQAICSGIPLQSPGAACGTTDPDGTGELKKSNCQISSAGDRCMYVSLAEMCSAVTTCGTDDPDGSYKSAASDTDNGPYEPTDCVFEGDVLTGNGVCVPA